jgi:hypothetical protein
MRDKAEFANATDNELTVLGAVIEYGDFLGGHEKK